MHATDYAAPRISPKIGATSEDAVIVAYRTAEDEGNLDYGDADTPGDPEHRAWGSGFASGVEFGLAAAAAIVTHGFDIEAATMTSERSYVPPIAAGPKRAKRRPPKMTAMAQATGADETDGDELNNLFAGTLARLILCRYTRSANTLPVHLFGSYS